MYCYTVLYYFTLSFYILFYLIILKKPCLENKKHNNLRNWFENTTEHVVKNKYKMVYIELSRSENSIKRKIFIHIDIFMKFYNNYCEFVS